MKYADLDTQSKLKVGYEDIRTEEKKKGGFGFIPLFVILIVVSVLFFLFRKQILSIFDPISIVSNVTSADLKTTDGRTNILILGSDKRNGGSIPSGLTDTILVASIGNVDKDVVLISLPRDLWVKWKGTDGMERYSKINAIYASTGGGSDSLTSAVEEVLGMPIHYYALVTFDLFEEVVDTLGGVDVTVDNTFTDSEYPIEGMEDDTCGYSNEEIAKKDITYFSCRYEVVTFTQGTHKMDGNTALKFSRSRHGDNNEGTDFARAKRQQKVIMAIKDKALSIQTLINPSKLKELYDVYANNVDTDITFGTIQNFYLLSQQIDFSNIVSIVLDDRSQASEGGLLYAPEDTKLYEGQYVLIPRSGDYAQIHAYVQKYLFGDR